MRIQHNITALNANRNLTWNNNAVGKSLEKLSSGYRINRAGDDAAGLAVSEKMRAQISCLTQAETNCNDGISLIQTAEGALNEVHDMLNRMVELSEQSANGTYDQVDRDNLQAEVKQLQSEIDRISEATNFNGINLLDGSLEMGKKGNSGSVTVDLSALSGTMMGGVTTVDATKGKFNTDAAVVGNAAVTTANLGDKIDFTFEYVDNDGKHQQSTVSFTLGYADGKSGALAAGSLALIAEDGTKYAVAAADEYTDAELGDALVAEFAKNSDLAANFKVAESATDGTFEFTAVNAGADGAQMTGMVQSVTAKATGNVTNTGVTVFVGKDTANNVSTASDSFATIDLSKAKVWDGTKEKLEEAVFEINGEKFAFIAQGTTLSDEQKNMLSEAGVGNNYVVIAGANTAAADVTKMAGVIGAATGLKVETGTLTVGDTNTWATNTPTTVIALKDAVSTSEKTSGGLTLQIGDTSDDFNKLTVSIDSMSSKSLAVDKVDISSQQGASDAVKVIKDAINKVSSTRGTLGAMQNRLEHTINNLSVTNENITNAESRIRDTDMAKEMMAYTSKNIISQAAQSMLAQANQQPQQVLSLLQ